MFKSLTRPWLPSICFEGEAEGAGAPPAPAATPAAMGFTPSEAPTGEPPAAPAPAAPPPPAWEGPDWVAEKYRGQENPIEAQAQGYSEAMKVFTTKTADLRTTVESEVRETVTEEIRAEWAAERGGLETPEAYAYPENVAPPSEAVDGDFRGWAQRHAISQEAFNEAVGLYGMTLPDPTAEHALLGKNADARIATINAWGGTSIPGNLHEATGKLMQTAEGVELVEHFMNVGRDPDYLPGGGVPAVPLTRESIREMQNDPRYYDPIKREDSYVKKVADAWAKFGTQQK